MTIRSARPGEVNAIAAVHVASWRDTYSEIAPAAAIARNTDERRRELWHRAFGEGRRDILVAEENGSVVGFICGGPMPASIRGRAPIRDHDAYLYALYVDRVQHRRGVGRRLLVTLIGRLHERGMRSLALHVADGNPARGFYERLGARFIEREPVNDDIDEAPQLAYGWSDFERMPTGTPSVNGSTARR